MLALLLAAWAQNVPSERAYQRTIDLVDGLYLYPEKVDAGAMLQASAASLSEAVHWLLVDGEGTSINLRHGDGTLIGSVNVASIDTLPAALVSIERMVRSTGKPLGDVDLQLELLKGMTESLDRYSRVLAGDRLDRFDVRLKGTLVGIGLTVSIRDDDLVVTSITDDGPAQRGDVRPGDKILRIDGRSTVNMPTSEATRRIRGEPDTSVVLTLLRDGRELLVSLQRAEVVVPNVESRVLADDIGYVKISHVSQRTVQNLKAELAKLRAEGALERGMVLDLRRNTGGSMKESARTVDEFVEQGLLLRTVGPDGNHVRNLQAKMSAEVGGELTDIPVVVLVDERTASGAEIIAGSLLELERTALVGTRSYGKGTVQKIYPLSEDMRLKLTVAQYLLANDRVIADRGLVPDVVVGEIELDSYGVHYEDWDEERLRTPLSDVVPWVQESWSWRQTEQPWVDLVEEIGRRAVLGTQGPSRERLLGSLQQTAATVRTEQEAHLAEALAAQGIDWSLPETPPTGPMPAVHVQVSGAPDPERDDVIVITATAENRGKLPLHQARVELSSEFRLWDGLVIPIGRLDPGASLTGEVRIGLNPGVNPREDDVSVSLRAAHHGAVEAGQVALHCESTPDPDLKASVRLVGEGPRRRAEVTVTNPSKLLLQGLEVHFAYPGDVDIELLDRASRVSELGPGRSHTFSLEVQLGPDAPAEVPMRVVIEADRHGKLAHWPVTVPTDGAPVVLQQPTIQAERPLSAPAGPFRMPLVVSDDGTLDHIVVFHNGEKVDWAAGGTSEVRFATEVDLVEGRNRLVVVGLDDQGIEERTQFVVRGVVPDDAIAAPGTGE